MNRNGDREAGRYKAARAALVRALRSAVKDERVLDAFARVPRERFVAPDLRDVAYSDQPLPIGHGQTISQPTIVALMLEALKLKGDEKVLDVGTGSGYQAALLATLAASVVTVELIPGLAANATRVLDELGYANVSVHGAGACLGWSARAPYDAIVVAAAAPRVPQSLVEQLAPAGRLVIPVGERQSQDLLVVERRPEGPSVTRHGGCRFVPLLGEEAYST